VGPTDGADLRFFFHQFLEFIREGTRKLQRPWASLKYARSKNNPFRASFLHLRGSGVDLFAWASAAAVDSDYFDRPYFGEASFSFGCH
jgi:hypothetical protein